MKELANKFPREAHKFRVMNLTKKKDKGSFAVYIDARNVMDRLDDVVGPEAWSDEYKPILSSDEKWVVQCWLTVNGVTKSDVGEDTKSGFANADPKAAFSDALKRAAVKFGIGRYLYALDTDGWYPVDEWRNFTPQSTATINRIIDKQLGLNPQFSIISSGGDRQISIAQDENGKVVAELNRVPELAGGEPTDLFMNPDIEFSKEATALITKLRDLDKSSNKPMSAKQYQFMTGLVNGVVGEDKHTEVFSTIFGKPVSSDAIPGWKTKELIDWLNGTAEEKPETKQAMAKKAIGEIAAKVTA